MRANHNLSTRFHTRTSNSPTPRMLPEKSKALRTTIETHLKLPDLASIRKLFLKEYALPEDTSAEISHRRKKLVGTSLRGRLWKACLLTQPRQEFDVNVYLALLDQNGCVSEEYESIYGDVLRSRKIFSERVHEDEMKRVLQAFTLKEGMGWYSQSSPYHVGLFLYQMSEIEAFYVYSEWMKYHVPVIFQVAHSKGTYAVLEVARSLLQHLDPELEHHLSELKVEWRIFGLPWVTTFFAENNPLEEVIKLWDFFVLFGFHLVSLVVACFLILHRHELMQLDDVTKVHRTLKEYRLENAQQLISIAVRLLREIPEEKYSRMRTVMTHKEVASNILKEELHTQAEIASRSNSGK